MRKEKTEKSAFMPTVVNIDLFFSIINAVKKPK